MKFISLFAGIGGFDLALERLGHECVYANDIDTYCKLVYDKHFRTKQTIQDIRTIDPSAIPNADLLCGGFPCPEFSIANKNRKGLQSDRGGLFFEILRILKAKRTPYILLENVRGILNHGEGETFKIVLAQLGELGYELQWFLLNSKDFGVAQQRQRVFIVGNLRGYKRPEILSERQGYTGNDKKKPEVEPRGLCLTTRSGERQDPTSETFIGHCLKAQSGSFYNSQAETLVGYCLTAKNRGVGQIWNETHLARIDTKRERSDARVSKKLDRIRGRMLGNAVTVNVVYEVAKHLPIIINHLKGETK